MQIDKLEISNVMGVEHLEIKAGKLNVISGGNGAGKTSVLEAIKTALGAGRDATLIRAGQKSGKVVVVFDEGSTLTRAIRPSGDDAKIVREEGVTENAKPVLDQLVQVFSLNPAKFLMADEKEQIAMIQRAIPQPLDIGAVCQAMNGDWWMEHYEERLTTDEILARVEKEIYERRTAHNGGLKEKRATIESLSGSLPSEGAADVRAELEAVQAEHDAMAADDAKFLAAANEAEREALRERDEAWDRQIKRLEAELAAAQASKREERTAIRQQAETARHQRMQANERRRGELATRRAELQAQAEAQSKAANTREVVEQMRAEAAVLEAKSKKCTEMIEALREFRRNAIEHMPIKGVEIKDGALFVDGVPFRRVNTARQVQIAVQVARYGAGDIPVICVDGLECLEPAMFEKFCQFAAQTPELQFFVTRVSEGPLRVETERDLFSAAEA